MHKTIAYWIERLMGFLLGLLSFYLVLRYWNGEGVLKSSKYYDVIIKASSSLFGFLLTILALTINGSNVSVVKMKEKGSFQRLVRYHKTAVLLALCLVIFSVIMFSLTESGNKFEYVNAFFNLNLFKILVSIHMFATIWTAADTILFVLVFYKILLTDIKQ